MLLLFLHCQTKLISILTCIICPLWDSGRSFCMKKIEIVPVEKVGWFWCFFFPVSYLSATFTSWFCSSCRCRHQKSRARVESAMPGGEQGGSGGHWEHHREPTLPGATWSHAGVTWLHTTPPGFFGNHQREKLSNLLPSLELKFSFSPNRCSTVRAKCDSAPTTTSHYECVLRWNVLNRGKHCALWPLGSEVSR